MHVTWITNIKEFCLRYHTSHVNQCFQTGSVVNGALDWSTASTAACPQQPMGNLALILHQAPSLWLQGRIIIQCHTVTKRVVIIVYQSRIFELDLLKVLEVDSTGYIWIWSQCLLKKAINYNIPCFVLNFYWLLGGTWETATVEILNGQVRAYLDGQLVTTLSPLNPSAGAYAGVIIANGYENVGAFRNYIFQTFGK